MTNNNNNNGHFSWETRRVKLGMMKVRGRNRKKDWHFNPMGMSTSPYPWEKKPRKKKAFELAR